MQKDVQLTHQEVALLTQVLNQININPGADDALVICSLVQSLKQKLGALVETQIEQATQPSTSDGCTAEQ